MTTRLYLVRHGATTFTAEDRFAGAGVGLFDEGRWQAAKLGERRCGAGVTAVYCSPFARTDDTATAGLTRREAEERFADEYASWNGDPLAFAPADSTIGDMRGTSLCEFA